MAMGNFGIFNLASADVIVPGVPVDAANAPYAPSNAHMDSTYGAISYAQGMDPTESALGTAFSAPSMQGAAIYDIALDAAQSTDALETCEMAPPWIRPLQERLTNMIAQGLYGPAMDLLETHLTGFSDLHAKDTMEMFGRVLANLEASGLGQQVLEFANIFKHSGLEQALSFDFGGFEHELSLGSTGMESMLGSMFGSPTHDLFGVDFRAIALCGTVQDSQNMGDITDKAVADSIRSNIRHANTNAAPQFAPSPFGMAA